MAGAVVVAVGRLLAAPPRPAGAVVRREAPPLAGAGDAATCARRPVVAAA